VLPRSLRRISSSIAVLRVLLHPLLCLVVMQLGSNHGIDVFFTVLSLSPHSILHLFDYRARLHRRGLRRSCRLPGPGAWRCGGEGGGPSSENGEIGVEGRGAAAGGEERGKGAD